MILPAPGSGDVWAVAHRGSSRVHPENTLAAFDAAIEEGCDAIELDVQLSRDGVPVCWHDRTLARAGGGRLRVHQAGLSELRKLDPGRRFDGAPRGLHISTLEEVLCRYAGRVRLLVEIKTREGSGAEVRHRLLARTVAGMLSAAGLADSTALLCFEPALLDEARAAASELTRILNVRPGPVLGARLRERLGTIDALSADIRTLTTRFARTVVGAGCPLLVFTCNTPARLRTALSCGATAIMSDRVRWLSQALRNRERQGEA
ncbi:MAG: hypothetical protein GY716_00180 [bacterium]|nr:hypothetical protein [bacterium]